MKKGYYLNDKRTSYSAFRYYLYKLCKIIILENAASFQEFKNIDIEKLTFEKVQEYFNKMKNEGAIIEGKKLKFQIIP